MWVYLHCKFYNIGYSQPPLICSSQVTENAGETLANFQLSVIIQWISINVLPRTCAMSQGQQALIVSLIKFLEGSVRPARANIVAGAILKILVIPLRLVGLVSSHRLRGAALAAAAIVPLSPPLVLQYPPKAFPDCNLPTSVTMQVTEILNRLLTFIQWLGYQMTIHNFSQYAGQKLEDWSALSNGQFHWGQYHI